MTAIALLVEMVKSKLGITGNAPGKSVQTQATGFEGQTITTEVYQSPGVMSVPPDGARGVWVPIGGSNRYGVVIATQNYSLNIEINQGETAIYSTTPDGQTVKALMKLKVDGSIEVNGNSKRLMTDDMVGIFTTFIASLNASLATAGGPPVTLDLSSAKTTTLKTGG